MAIELEFEHSLYAGDVLLVFLYAIQCYMFVQSTYLFLNRPRVRNPFVRKFYIAFGTMLLIAMTLDVVSTLLIGGLMWIDHRDVPGGPPAYYAQHSSSWFETLSLAASTFANIAGEMVLIYRSYMIWGSRMWVLILLAPFCLANIGISTVTLIQNALPRDGILRGLPAGFSSIRNAVAVTGHASVTILISARLLMMRQKAQTTLVSQSAHIYTSVVAIFVESALPYSAAGIACLVARAVDTPMAPVYSRLFSAFCCLTPQLIVLRIAMGLGWNSNTEAELTTVGPLVFAQRATTHSAPISVGEIRPENIEVMHIHRESESALHDKDSRETLTV